MARRRWSSSGRSLPDTLSYGTSSSRIARSPVSRTYAATASYTFAVGDGARTLRVWYRDPWGNTSAPVAASIVVDTTAPTGGVVSAARAAAKITLSWTIATDAGSGLSSYRLVGFAGTTIPAAACTNGTVLYSGTSTTFAHSVAAQATWTYRMCASDNAGNTATGSTVATSAL